MNLHKWAGKIKNFMNTKSKEKMSPGKSVVEKTLEEKMSLEKFVVEKIERENCHGAKSQTRTYMTKNDHSDYSERENLKNRTLSEKLIYS